MFSRHTYLGGRCGGRAWRCWERWHLDACGPEDPNRTSWTCHAAANASFTHNMSAEKLNRSCACSKLLRLNPPPVPKLANSGVAPLPCRSMVALGACSNCKLLPTISKVLSALTQETASCCVVMCVVSHTHTRSW
jgi:hypothetical protein